MDTLENILGDKIPHDTIIIIRDKLDIDTKLLWGISPHNNKKVWKNYPLPWKNKVFKESDQYKVLLRCSDTLYISIRKDTIHYPLVGYCHVTVYKKKPGDDITWDITNIYKSDNIWRERTDNGTGTISDLKKMYSKRCI